MHAGYPIFLTTSLACFASTGPSSALLRCPKPIVFSSLSPSSFYLLPLIVFKRIYCQSCTSTIVGIPNERVSASTHLRGGDEDTNLTGSSEDYCVHNWTNYCHPTTHVSMVIVYCDKEPPKTAFTFTISAGPSLKFSFDQPVSLPVPTNRPFKRRRALSDVDGDGNEGRKKRRLRLHLITSRLSLPFSQPASNIVNRGISKIAVWAKNKALGRNVLRKAAIMNRVRLRMDAAKDFMRLQQERSKGPLALREIVVQKPRCYDLPLPPSPLGLSNYDALDLEDDMSDDDHDGEEGGIDHASSIYSDFNIMNPCGDGDDYDYLDALDGISPLDLPDTPPPPPEESIVEMLREKERQGDSYFVHLKG